MSFGDKLNLNREDYSVQLKQIIRESFLYPVLSEICNLDLPDWWVAGGAVRNTVWKYLYGDQCLLKVKDIDLVFFDKDAGRQYEHECRDRLSELFPEMKFDVKNQASFGVWRPWHFAFTDTVDGIAHWLHTSTAVGVSINKDKQLVICAPYGLSDLFDGIVKATPYSDGSEAADKKGREFLSNCPALKEGGNIPQTS